jgi:dihydrofolate reductase
MRKLIVLAQISLDGFVGGSNGEFDGFIDDQENLGFVCSLTDDADAALLGRVSYQLLNGDWPTAGSRPDATEYVKKYSAWYNRVPKYVLSTTLMPEEVDNAIVFNEDIVDEIQQLKAQEGRNILIFGSPTAVHYLREQNLIDGYWILLHPILFGQGIPLFKDLTHQTSLTLTAARHFESGMLAFGYEVK